MSSDYENRVLAYKSVMAQARCMLESLIITKDEYAKIDTIIAEKYQISSCSIYRENDLIYNDDRGNISNYKKVI